MNNKGLTGKEAALLAAARRELATPTPSPPGANQKAQVVTPAVSQAARASAGSAESVPFAKKTTLKSGTSADLPAMPDIATRMAMLMDAELRERKNRKQRVKKIYLTMVATVMVPSFLYITITIFKLLAR
jgi:hypothetical protein